MIYQISPSNFIKLEILLSWSLGCKKITSTVSQYLNKHKTQLFMGFPCGSAGKESTCNVGDLALIPGLGRSPGEGKGYPLQYSGLENSMDCIVHGVAKSWTQLSDFHFHCISSKRNTCANTHTHTPSQVAIRSFSCLSQPANISLWMSLLHSIFQEYLHFQRKK